MGVWFSQCEVTRRPRLCSISSPQSLKFQQRDGWKGRFHLAASAALSPPSLSWVTSTFHVRPLLDFHLQGGFSSINLFIVVCWYFFPDKQFDHNLLFEVENSLDWIIKWTNESPLSQCEWNFWPQSWPEGTDLIGLWPSAASHLPVLKEHRPPAQGRSSGGASALLQEFSQVAI